MATPVVIFGKSAFGPPSLQLASAQLCGIFGGVITNWKQLDGTLPDADISVVYRTESSSATALLTQHLAEVCVGENTGDATFVGQSVFADVFGGPNNMPSHFVAATGDNGVQVELSSPVRPEQIAYLSPDPQYTPPVNAAVAELVNRNSGIAYTPTVLSIETAISGSLVLPAGPMVLDPEDASYTEPTNPAYPRNWAPLVNDPIDGYPIVGTSNMLFSQCYAGNRGGGPNLHATDIEVAVRDFLERHYTTDFSPSGLVPLPTVITNTIRATFVDGLLYAGTLQIGDAAYCSSIVGRS